MDNTQKYKDHYNNLAKTTVKLARYTVDVYKYIKLTRESSTLEDSERYKALVSESVNGIKEVGRKYDEINNSDVTNEIDFATMVLAKAVYTKYFPECAAIDMFGEPEKNEDFFSLVESCMDAYVLLGHLYIELEAVSEQNLGAIIQDKANNKLAEILPNLASKHVKSLKVLLDNRGDPNTGHLPDGMTLLCVAAKDNLYDISKLLISYGAKVDLCYNRDYMDHPEKHRVNIAMTSPLLSASTAGHTKIVELLLQCGATVTKSILLSIQVINSVYAGSRFIDYSEILKLLMDVDKGNVVYVAENCPAFIKNIVNYNDEGEKSNEVINSSIIEDYNIIKAGELQNMHDEL